MQTMRITLVVQVILAALTVGACLGAVLPRLPDLVAVRAATSMPDEPTPAAYALSKVDGQTMRNVVSANADGSSEIAGVGSTLQVQVRAEVQAAGNANAEAQALGPGDTEAKANTVGPGSGQAVAYSTNPDGTARPAESKPNAAPVTSDATASILPTNVTTEPQAIVREPIINLRSGPGTGYTIMGMATQGQRFTPVGRTVDGSWWKVCCYDQQLIWIAGELADIRGAVENLEVVTVVPPPPTAVPVATNTPPPATATPTAPVTTPAPAYEFGLVEQNQFAEGVTPRVFLYIAQGAEGLGGYTLQVKKDNAYLPVNTDSFSGPPAFTWPVPLDRQRFYNLKVEFPGVYPSGRWEIQVIEDSTRKAVAAPVIFNLMSGDPRQEMYISLRR